MRFSYPVACPSCGMPWDCHFHSLTNVNDRDSAEEGDVIICPHCHNGHEVVKDGLKNIGLQMGPNTFLSFGD